MDFFIKKIFDGQSDELVHLQFQKFSKGKFENRAMVNAKKMKESFSVNTTAEFANELVLALAEKLGEEKTKVTGVVVSTKDLTGELDFEKKKQFMGVKQYIMNKEISGNEIAALVNKLPKAFFGLSFSAGDSVLKVKPKAPKSGKPGSKGDARPAVDFCKLKTKDSELVKRVLFDVDLEKFKVAEIGHDYIINEIILPKGETDPALIRERAKRKGIIKRYTTVDGMTMEEDKAFEA